MGKAVLVGEQWFVPLGDEVRLGPYDDEICARDDAEAVRRYVKRASRAEQGVADGFLPDGMR